MGKELIILAIYINVTHMSRLQVDSVVKCMIHDHEDMYKDTNKNVKVYYLPVENQETRIECIYPPHPVNSGSVENELLKIYKLIVNSKNDEAKEIVRNIERKLKFKKIKDKLNET